MSKPPHDSPRNSIVFVSAAIAIGLAIPTLILTGLDRTLLQIHFSFNWPAWINSVEMVANGWLYHTVLVIAIGLCLVIDSKLRRLVLVAVPMEFVLVHGLKLAFGRIRPVNGGDPLLFAPFSTIHDGYPSGHATILFMLTFIIGGPYRVMLVPCLCVTLGYCWLRIHIAAHFGSDLLAGALLGIGLAMTAYRLVLPSAVSQPRKVNPWPPMALALGSVVLGAIIALPWQHRPASMSSDEAESAVRALYAEILDRQPDAPGLSAYTMRLENAVPQVALLREVIGSDEYRRTLRRIESPADRLRDVYKRLLDREPTTVEISRDAPLITDTTRAGGRLELLIFRITFSDEYQHLHP